MNDRTDIACVIAEWWHNQKKRKDEIANYEEFISNKYEFSNQEMELIDSTIIVEKIMKVESLNPLKISKDYSQLTIRRPDGKKCIVQKFREEIQVKALRTSRPKEEKKIELLPVSSFKHIDNCCNTCKHEAYYMSGIDEEFYGKKIEFNRRDCINFNTQAQDFFRDHVKFTLSRDEIPPVNNCYFWEPANGSLISKKKKNVK